MVEKYFTEEVSDTVKKIKDSESDIKFVLITDTHLSDTGIETCENIKAVDNEVHYDFLVHMGDFLTGTIPEKASRRLLREEIEMYRSSTQSGKMFIAQGNHDGYRDESFKRQLVDSIVFDDKWYEDTKFIDSYGVKRDGIKAYYYYDIPDKKIRMVFLCSFDYSFNPKEKEYNKFYGYTEEQRIWFESEALNVGNDYTLLIFSHANPVFEPSASQWSNGGPMKGGPEIFECLLKAKKKGVKVGGWFYGHTHGDHLKEYEGINFCLTSSQAPYIPQLWKMTDGGTFHNSRDLKTVNQDLWDSLLLNEKERKITLIRFGAGDDRVFYY